LVFSTISCTDGFFNRRWTSRIIGNIGRLGWLRR